MRLFLLALLTLLPMVAKAQNVASSMQVPTAPDYADPADWACRPGFEARCTANLDGVALSADGRSTVVKFVPAADPPIDCFYVYPTASREKQGYANLFPGPAILKVIRAQAGRMASECRLYVPLYRQATLYDLHGGGGNLAIPYHDIAAAWAWYLAHDNHGRGVVLIGHSQGTILLQRLIANKIDGKPPQAFLVAAYLAGNPGLEVPAGQNVGGTFKHIPICSAASETGCAYVWSSYFAGDDAVRVFGLNKQGLDAACTDPVPSTGGAGGTAGTLDAYFSSALFPAAQRGAFVRISGQIAAVCQSDSQGAVLRITVLPGANAAAIDATLDAAKINGTSRDWGLHELDIALSQGSMLRLINLESAGWLRMKH